MPRAVVASEASRWWLSWRSFSPSPSAARSQAWHSQGTQNDRSCISGAGMANGQEQVRAAGGTLTSSVMASAEGSKSLGSPKVDHREDALCHRVESRLSRQETRCHRVRWRGH